MRLNWSTLKHISISPALLRWRMDHPLADTDALRLGRAIHCLVLEPDKFDSRWITRGQCNAKTKAGTRCESDGSLWVAGSWFCRVKGHAPEGAGAPPAELEIIDKDSRELAIVCAGQVSAHPLAAKAIIGGNAEHEMEWEDSDTGIACRGRTDLLQPDFLLDLKSTKAQTPREFEMDAARNLYHGQLAWYHDGAILAGKLPKDAKPPKIIAVSTSEPYDVAVYECPRVTLEAGRILRRDLLRQYAACQAADWWPGHSPDLRTLDLPDWAPGMNGSTEEGGDWA